jgi:glycosyltransferase involved in cell wall biosynthesis
MVSPVKRLLLVAYYFPPAAGGGVARALSFARYLPLHGWQVTVVCADPESAPLTDPSRELRLPEGVEVIRVSMPRALALGRRAVLGEGAARSSGLYRWARGWSSWALVPDSFVPWRAAAARAVLDRMMQGDVTALLTTSPPDTVHLVGLSARSAIDVPWIADFRDPWVGLTYKRPPTPWHAARQRQLRASILRNADWLLATTRASAELLRSLVGPARASRVRLVANGWEADVPDRGSGEPPSKGPLRIVYTGTLWDVPATRACLEGLSRALAQARGAALELQLVGPHESAERRLAERLGLSSVVRFHGQVPYEDSRRRQRDADVLLLLQVHGAGYEVAVPGKLYEYLASNKPILAFLPDGEAADLVRAAGGWVVAPGDAESARSAFERLLRGERPGGASPERSTLIDSHRRDSIAAGLARLLDEALAAKAENR